MAAPSWIRARRWFMVLAAIAVLRVAGLLFGFVNLDECEFALFGRAVQQGATPYVDIVDNKPPLTYLAFWLANPGGESVSSTFPIRVLGMLTVLLTAMALFAAARAWKGDERHGWAAAWLSLAAGLCEVPSVNSELLMNLPVAAALCFLVAAERRENLWLDVAGGAAAAVATLFKQQAAILPMAVVLAIGWETLRGRGLSWTWAWLRATCWALGFALPWLAVAAVLASLNGLDGLVDWLFVRPLGRVEASAALFSWSRLLVSIAICIAGAALLPWFLALRGTRSVRGAFHRTLVLLLAFTAVAVSMGGRFYEHYFLQFVPPLALLGAPELVALCGRWPELPRLRRAVIVALAVLPPIGYVGYTLARGIAGRYPGQEPKTVAVAEWLARHTGRDDRVFVWGDQSMIYCLADRLPGTRYMRATFHVGDVDPAHVGPTEAFSPHISKVDVDNTLDDLRSNAPAILIDTSTSDIHDWSHFPLRVVPELERHVEAHYRPEAMPAGTAVYRRVD